MRRPRILGLVATLAAGCGDGGSDDAGTAGGTDTSSSGSNASTSASSSMGSTASSDTSTTSSVSTDATGATTSASSTGAGTEESGDTGGGGEACVDDHRVVAFVANWTACPTAQQLAQYSHVVVAFAVTYTWDPNGNLCDLSCTIQPLEGCSGTSLSDLVADLHAEGIEVLVSFGGAGMGGVWEGTCGEMAKCWDACLDQADAVADQLVQIVADNDLDGVDIDYEYCLDDPAYIGFVEGLTTSLRAELDAAFPGERKLVTHAPMDSELEVGDSYYEIVQAVAGDIDFLMPQYYNGGLSPFTMDGLGAIVDHYDALVEGVFAGDASRVVFGYCIEPGCSPVATQPAALQVAQMFDAWYPQNGGIFFWAHPNDTDAWFSQPFRDHYDATVCPP